MSGFSNGGMFAATLGCALNDRVAAVVEVIACLGGRRALAAATFGARLSAAAPWLPVLTFLLFAGFLVVFRHQCGSSGGEFFPIGYQTTT